MSLADTVPRIVLALFIGGLIGLERERRGVPAGIRTHMLVCAGSTLITLVSFLMVSSRADATRIPAQIVSGIGFLGAGTIFRSGSDVRGLTTAAGLWLVAAVGMGIASGAVALELAVITALLVWAVNTWLREVENRWVRPHSTMLLTTSRAGDVLGRVFEGLAQRGVTVHEVQWITAEPSAEQGSVRLTLHLPGSAARNDLSAWLSQQPGVRQITWE